MDLEMDDYTDDDRDATGAGVIIALGLSVVLWVMLGLAVLLAWKIATR